MQPVVYTYFDYRRFLKDQQKWLKSVKPYFTMEYIAQQSGLKSRGHMSLILNGSKSIPDYKVELYADIFCLKGKEKDFFCHLVRYNQEKSFRKKKKFLDSMIDLMRISDKKLVPAQYKLCEKWYTPIVLEVIRLIDFVEEWETLAKMVRPPITVKQAKEAVQVLQSINLIQQNDQGFWEPTDIIFTFGEGWKSIAGRAFQSQAIEMAQQALIEVPVEERDISTLTLSIGNKTYQAICDSLKMVRKEILSMARSEKNAEKVYQLNLALFPVSQKREP